MAFFTSEYECKLDAKGRLTLPAKIKVNLPEVSTNELVLRKGFEVVRARQKATKRRWDRGR